MNEVSLDQVIPAEPGSPEYQRTERLGLFGERLDGRFRAAVALKSKLEERWLEDTRQYHGEYDPTTLEKIQRMGGSEAFVNLTRVKCNAVEARLGDMLMPTEDRNWDIRPTPVPELQMAAAKRTVVRGPDGQPLPGPNGGPMTAVDVVAKVQAEAERAADLMRRQMDDQLAECGYNSVLRSVIHNMAVYGTGILKGPVVRAKSKRKYQQSQAIGEDGIPVKGWGMQMVEDLTPAAECVSPWDFFPEGSPTSMDDCEAVFERHRFTAARLRELAKLPGFLPEQINAVLSMDPERAMSGNIDSADSDAVRSVGGRSRYEVIEYSGPIDVEDLVAAGVEVDPDDKLTTYQGSVWFCCGKVLKAAISLLETGELMYDVVPLERDDTSIFGFGVPYMMRHSQRAGNSAWRMILDNARLSVGPQVVYRRGKVVPSNNDPRLSPLKTWEVTDPNVPVNDAFAVFPVMPNFQGMFQIFETVRALTDEETGLPMIAQGQQSGNITKTAQGMSILMNSANTVLRRMVKEFDDRITSRFIRRLYDYNMQFGTNEDAKGDYCIIPMGSVSLMVREQQSQGLMQLSQLGAVNPEFAQRIKWGDLLRSTVKSMSINADGLVKTEEELQAEREQQAQQAAQNPPPMPPEIQVKMAQVQMAQAELQFKQQEAQIRLQMEQAEVQARVAIDGAKTEAERARVQATIEGERMRAQAAMAQAQADMARIQVEREMALIKLAAEREMTLEEVRKEFGIKALEIDAANQRFNAEMRVKNKMGSGI